MASAAENVSPVSGNALPLFVCCARENRADLGILSKHLAAIRDRVTLVHFDNVPAGSNLRELQYERLRTSRFAIVLITPELLASDDCRAEVDLAISMADSGVLEILPVLVKACVFGASPLAALTLLPRSGAISQSLNPDDAWVEVANEIAMRVAAPQSTLRANSAGLATSHRDRSLLLMDATSVPSFGEVLCANLSTDFAITLAREDEHDAYRKFDCIVLCAPPDATTHTTWMRQAFMLAGAYEERREGRIVLLGPRDSHALFGEISDMKWIDYDASIVTHSALLVQMPTYALAVRRAFASVRPRAFATALRRAKDGKEILLSIRRLNSLIVDLRDALITLPTNFNSSIKNNAQFRRMKETVASNVWRIAEPFRMDAENCNALKEFDLLVAATGNLVRTLPYPTEPFLEGKSLGEAIQGVLALAFRAASERDAGLDGAAKAVETDVYRRLDKTVSAYIDWWHEGNGRLRDATTQLLDTLRDASIYLNEELLEKRGLK
jgi:hypothetical protein